MAKLETEGFQIEIIPKRNSELYTEYTFSVKYKNKSLFNEELFKKLHSKGEIKFDDDGESNDLLLALEKALEKKEISSFEYEGEPQIAVEIYPDMYFPFKKKEAKIIHISEEMEKELEDCSIDYTMIIHIDSFAFEGENYYTGCGPALLLSLDEEELREFTTELKKELNKVIENS